MVTKPQHVNDPVELCLVTSVKRGRSGVLSLHPDHDPLCSYSGVEFAEGLKGEPTTERKP